MVDIFRCKDLDMPGSGKSCNGIKPEVFIWVLPVCEYRLNLEPMSDEGFYADTSEVVVCQYDGCVGIEALIRHRPQPSVQNNGGVP